jgi:hypothetical protein
VAEQVIQRTGLGVPREPRILEVALDQAATLQRAADASGDLLYQRQEIQARKGSAEQIRVLQERVFQLSRELLAARMGR